MLKQRTGKQATNLPLRMETLKNDRRSHKLSTVSSLELPPKGIVLHAAEANPQEFSRSVKPLTRDECVSCSVT